MAQLYLSNPKYHCTDCAELAMLGSLPVKTSLPIAVRSFLMAKLRYLEHKCRTHT